MKKMFAVIALSAVLAGCASNRDESAGTVTGLRVISDSADEAIGTDRGSLGTGRDTGTGTSGQEAIGGTGTLDQRTAGTGSDTDTGTSKIGTSGAGTTGAPSSGASRSGVR